MCLKTFTYKIPWLKKKLVLGLTVEFWKFQFSQ